jgi:hypothetical protein
MACGTMLDLGWIWHTGMMMMTEMAARGPARQLAIGNMKCPSVYITTDTDANVVRVYEINYFL